MHPNWKALATLHIPLKRFITEGASVEHQTLTRRNGHQIGNVTATEVKKFYDEIINTPESAPKVQLPQPQPAVVPKYIQQLRFDKNKFFRAAMNDDAETISLFNYHRNDINTTDTFGWTALMMAACEGAANAVEALLLLGANADLRDKSGNTALSLAEMKKYSNIVTLLSRCKQEPINMEEYEAEDEGSIDFFCEICAQNFSETSIRDHITSTVHQFNEKKAKLSPINRFNIPQRNRGLKIMLMQGWDKESGLGPTNSGRLYPVKTVIRKDRTGLGTKQDPARVTHFEAYDLRAIKAVPRLKPKTRNDMRREKLRDWKRERRLRQELA